MQLVTYFGRIFTQEKNLALKEPDFKKLHFFSSIRVKFLSVSRGNGCRK